MTDKKYDIKTMIELIIANIDECNSEFVTYKADSIKLLLQDMLEYMDEKEQILDKIETYCTEQNLKYDNVACDILNLINSIERVSNVI